jgi:hypothetical protein
VVAARGRHPTVVVELGRREVALLRLDARPLDGEPVGVEPEAGNELDVVEVSVVVVARVARGLGEHGRLQVLEHPLVAVEVVALDLVRGRGHAPEEPLRVAIRREALRRGPAWPDDDAETRSGDEPGSRRQPTRDERTAAWAWAPRFVRAS